MKLRGGMVVAALAALLTMGCLKKVLTDGQIKSTRVGSSALNTLQDYEIAKYAAQAGLAQIEGMHSLQPDNTDALFMLTRGWAGVAFGFVEDEYEQAYERGDELMAEYHLARTRAAFLRARYYGVELLGHTAQGFEQAKINQQTLRAWLVQNFTEPEEAGDLLWAGYAWIGHVSASRDFPDIVGELYVGVEMVRRSVELDEKLEYATGHIILGAYHARTAMAELDDAKKHFERALQINGGKNLTTKLNYATRYYCAKNDKANYVKLLHEVLEAGDVLPEQRLQNTIAKRRARRYLSNKIWQEECGFAS